MKKASSLFFIPLYALFVILLLITDCAFAQDEKYPLNMELSTWKYSDGTRTLINKVTATNDKGDFPVEGLSVNFYNSSALGDVFLGTANTASDGKAVFTVNNSVRLKCNDAGFIRFVGKSDGNSKFSASETSLEVKDARIELQFNDVDSVRKIAYRGVVTNAAGKDEPLANMDIYLYVPRMFSQLKIADGWLEEDGEGETVFPGDLIGDSAGLVKIYARIEGNADFGNLEASGETRWALKKHGDKLEGPQRELWTPIAPLWMIITLIIMLTGVWAHYIYAIIQLILIKKAGKIKHDTPL